MPHDSTRFHWTTFDVRSLLPLDWVSTIRRVAENSAASRVLVTDHETSREGSTLRLPVETVSGLIVEEHLPWLTALYSNAFREFAQVAAGEPISVMQDRRFAVNINLQRGRSRYECHIDTNPVEGLLYVTSHPEGEGGELVVSNDPNANSVEAVERNCTVVEPKSGYLMFFDGRHHPHFVRPLRSAEEVRLVVAMNYYTREAPESTRPLSLNRHLTGHE